MVGPQSCRERMASRIRVHDVDLAGAGVLGQLCQQQAHRPRAVDQVIARDLHVDLVEAVDGARERLHQGAPRARNVGGQLKRAGRRHADEFCAGAVGPRDPDAVPVLTKVEAAGPTLPARPVVKRGIHRDEVTDLDVADIAADRHDLTAELVAGNDRVARRGKLAPDDVDVGAADAARLDLEHRVAWAWRGVLHLLDGDLVRLLDHHRLHLTAPMVRPRMSCFCAIQPASSTGRLANVAAAASLA